MGARRRHAVGRFCRSLALTGALLIFMVVFVGAKPTPAPRSLPARKPVQEHKANAIERLKKTAPTPQRKSLGKKADADDKAPVGSRPAKGTLSKPSSSAVTKTGAATLRRYSSAEIGDPYELSRFFRGWWNIAEVPIDWASAAAWLQHKQGECAERLSAMLAEVSEHFERRRVNARRATLAIYLMGRLRQQNVAIPAPPIGYQVAALRRAVIDDAVALVRYAQLEERLRVSEATILGEDFRTTSALEERAANFAPADGVTITNLECVAQWNGWLLMSAVPPKLNEILPDYRSLTQAERQRYSLRQLAPPLPELAPAYWPLVGEDVPLPVEPLPTPRPHIANEVARIPKHETVTLRVAAGGPIRCAADGIVRFAGEMRGLDHVVIVEHAGGRLSVYSLLGAAAVSEGQQVRAGDVIGMAAGSAGAGETEVSFEVRDGAKAVSPRVLLGDRSPFDVLVRPK